MELHNLTKTTKVKLRRLGQGHGSGRGKTGGRGTKGQNARNSVPVFFEGGALPMTKRLPFLRGRGRNKSINVRPFTVSVLKLNSFPAKSIVDVDSMIKKGLTGSDAKRRGVKIIGNGELKVVLTVKTAVTAGARKSIEAAGGSLEI